VRARNLLHLYRIRLRLRWVAELLALAGIGAGVALVFAALVASTSLTGSVRELSEGIVGEADFQLAVRSPAGLGPRVAARARALPGVAATAPVVEARGNLVGPDGLHSVLLIGGDRRFARFGGPLPREAGRALRGAGRAPRRGSPGLALPTPLAGELGLEAGDAVRVETGAGATRVRVSALLGGKEIGSLAESPVALAPPRLIRAIGGMGDRISRVFVEAKQGREDEAGTALRELAGERLDVGPADREAAIFERAAYPTNQSTALFSVLGATVGFLFAFSAMLLTVPQRQRLIADLRLAGFTPGGMVAILLVDALLLGAAGTLLGLALGDTVSRLLFGSAPEYLSSAFAIGSQRIVTPQSVAIAATAGLAAACVAVLAPLRNALARLPGESPPATVATGRESWLTAAGGALLAGTVAIVALAPRAALAGVGTLTGALLLLLPLLMRLSTAAFDSLARRTQSPVAIFASLELRSGSGRARTLALAATGAVAVFATVSLGGARADLQRGLDAVSDEASDGASVWVAFRGPTNIFATAPFRLAPGRSAVVERLPEVRRVERNGGAFLDVGDHRAWVWARSPKLPGLVPAGQIREGDAELAEARLRRGGWLTLSQDLAAGLGVGVGDRFTLPAPVPTAFRVAALTTNLGWPGGAIAMSARDYARAWESEVDTSRGGTSTWIGDAPSSLAIQLEGGASAAAVARHVRVALADRRLRIETRAERAARQRAASRAGLSRLDQIALMVVISAVLAMAASMGGLIWQRRPTLAMLETHGASKGVLWRSLLLESGLLLGAGCLAGALFGLLGQVLLDRALETITGFPVIYATAAREALRILLLVTGVAVAILAVPGWLAVRGRPGTRA
jgi:putative ABC transport system permease protein